jgi:hypothetical protein
MDEKPLAVEPRRGIERGDEATALLGGETGVVLRVGEMGEHARQPQVRVGQNLRAKRGSAGVPDADAPHPGVDLQVDGERFAGLLADGGKALDLLLGRDGGRHVVLREKLVLFRQHRAEQENRPARAELAQRSRLGEVGHREKVGAGVHEARRRVLQAVAIGVGFDDGHVAHVRGERGADEAQITF